MQDWAKANGIANAENLSASQIEKANSYSYN